MRDDLGVGLRCEHNPGSGELVAELGEILDDPVVDDGDGAVLAHMGVRVDVCRTAVSRPAGVANTDGGCLERVLPQE